MLKRSLKPAGWLVAFLLLAATAAFGQAPELQVPHSQNVPTINGVISDAEWGDAAAYQLTFTHYLTSNTQPMPVWLLNDGTFLYVAAKAPFSSDPYSWYGLYFDGDHSHTLHGSATAPHITVNYNKAGTASPAYPFYNAYRYVQAGCAAYSTTAPYGAEHAFTVSGTSELSFEFKVPLSDLTAEPGETVGFSITLGVNSTSGNNWAYPGNAGCDPELWANLAVEASAPAGPSLSLSATHHDFGLVESGDEANWILTAQNIGSSTLVIDFTIGDASVFRISPSDGHAVLAGGNSVDIPIYFKPCFANHYATTAKVFSNDPANSLIMVALSGQGALVHTASLFGVLFWDSNSDDVPNGDGDYVSGADVLLYSYNEFYNHFNTPLARTHSDENGYYEFCGLQPGEYWVGGPLFGLGNGTPMAARYVLLSAGVATRRDVGPTLTTTEYETFLGCMNSWAACGTSIMGLVPVFGAAADAASIFNDGCAVAEANQSGDTIGAAIAAAFSTMDIALASDQIGLTEPQQMALTVLGCIEGFISDGLSARCGGYSQCIDELNEWAFQRGENRTIVEVNCPVGVSISDGEGRILEIDERGVVSKTIPQKGAIVNLNGDKLAIIDDPAGTYSLRITGNATAQVGDAFALSILSPGEDDSFIETRFQGLPTGPGAIAVVQIGSLQQDQRLYFDIDGDGTAEGVRIPQSVRLLFPDGASFSSDTWYNSWIVSPPALVYCHIGDLPGGYRVDEIDTLSIKLNGRVTTSAGSVRMLSSSEGFTGPVLEVAFEATDVVLSLGFPPLGSPCTISIEGDFLDGVHFRTHEIVTVQEGPGFASLSGTVTGCNSRGLMGVNIDLYDLQGAIWESVITDEAGNFQIDSTPNGIYTVGLQVPLGLTPVSTPLVATEINNAPLQVNFELAEAATGKTKDLWWWSGKLADIKNGTVNTQFGVTREQVDAHGQKIYEHFYLKTGGYALQIPGLTYAGEGAPLAFDDIYNVFFAPDKDTNPGKVRMNLLTVLLDVASGDMSQLKVVSADGIKVSQAITYYCSMYPAGWNDWTVWWNIMKIHCPSFGIIPAGVIPPSTPTVLYKETDEALPTEFALSQNFPNPFNPVTTIGFSLPSAADVTLDIYNAVGQRVASLASGYKEAGQYSVTWDATAFASGVYFYRLTAGDYIETKKMLLLK